jgi:hypothetical protein
MALTISCGTPCEIEGAAAIDKHEPDIGKKGNAQMKPLVLALRILSIAFIAVSALHFFVGMQADAMLGAPVLPQMASEPSLDSQNRFYGITFSLLGVVLLICVTDLRRYEPIVAAALGVLFMAGIARVVSWAIHGAPSLPIVGILCADLLLPPILYFWLKRSLRASPASP